MIWGKWVDPNFKFRATDEEGIVYEFICFAESEDELRKQLKKKGLTTVEYIERYYFSDWKKRAQAATQKAIQTHEENKKREKNKEDKKLIKFRSEIWAELKWHLFELFHGKCAYCEGKPRSVASGDVEHFRPKSKVDEDEDHPGYFWLAYDETNLLPSCELCNRAHAKMTHFPVIGKHARDSQKLADEQPLLLNPYDRRVDPFQHLEFDATGRALPHRGSQYGESSRIHYHLNRNGLSEARYNAMLQVRRDFLELVSIFSHEREDACKTFRTELRFGKREYSAAQVWELERLIEQYEHQGA
jgi:uncharacterized protein (TIGR02646 family)